MATTNMLLTKPSVSVTAGPTWATNLNTDIDLIDAHDHSSDKGVKVTQSGINITADLEFNANDATEVRTVRFDASTVSIDGSTDVRVLYHVDGDLYYRNESGDAVQLTDGSAINISSAGGITDIIGTDGSFHYNSTSKTFTARYNDSGLLPALVACKDLTIYKSGAFTYSCKLQHTASATTTLTLPNTTATLAHIGSASQTFAGAVTISGGLTVDGTTTYVSTLNLQVEDKNIIINKGGSTSGAATAGLNIEGDGAAVVGYMRVATDNTNFEFNPPGNAFVLTLDIGATKTISVSEDLTLTGSLNVEATSVINQDLSTDSTAATFATLTCSTQCKATAATATTSTSTGCGIFAGGVGIVGDIWLGDDLTMDSDGCILNFGNAQEISFTHLVNEGIRSTGRMYEHGGSFAQRAFTQQLILG